MKKKVTHKSSGKKATVKHPGPSFGKLQDLIDVMNKLLGPGGCPWDREQSHLTLAPYAIEEAHELAEAIESNEIDAMKEELGDFMFQVIFHCALAERERLFSLTDVINTVCDKLIRRHPHVFGNIKVKDSSEVLKNWNQIKTSEKKNKGNDVFQIPVALPALQRAQKIGDKTKNMKFDWVSTEDVFKKVEEEVEELRSAFRAGNTAEIKEELGDVFFVLAQFARHMKFEAETVARGGNQKFEKRFKKLLELSKSQNKDFQTLDPNEKEKLWQRAKQDSK